MPTDRFILRPLDCVGGGSGHMRRCYELALRLGSGARLIVDAPSEWNDLIPGMANHHHLIPYPKILSEASGGEGSTLVVFDRRESSLADIEEFAALGTPVLLDDSGPARHHAPFVIDTIPGPRRGVANLASPGLLDLPAKTRIPDPLGPILVSFGGQDPENLTLPVLDALVNECAVEPGRITVTMPRSKKHGVSDALTGIRILQAPNSLRDELSRFGLVICSFGITLWEALAAGCAVLTVDPSNYHAELSRFSRIPGIGRVGKTDGGELTARSVKHLMRLLNDVEHLTESANWVDRTFELGREDSPLPSLLSSLEAPPPRCAACAHLLPRVIARFHRRSYYRCPECGIIGLYRFDCKDDEYGSAYFDAEYRDQYGRSYLEDFHAIKAMAASRLTAIGRRVDLGRLLDVGCAYGPFLQAATESGFRAQGIDISRAAAEYVREQLGLPVSIGSFTDPKTVGNAVFDVVTLWYVIEHFPDLNQVLHTLSRRVRSGGVLAFSTPNGSGISARRSLKRFLYAAPSDHYTIWDIRSARGLLRRHGFRVYRTRVTGHHPERFPGRPEIGGIVYRIIMVISRLLRLGDTFEVYAVKISTETES